VRAIDLVSGRRPKASEERTRGRVPSACQAGLDGSLVGPITEFVPDSPLEQAGFEPSVPLKSQAEPDLVLPEHLP
jgi:hypothetical protein